MKEVEVLSRGTITSASRIMLPFYPLLSAWLGFAYLFGGPTRTMSPAFDAAKLLMPMTGWGVVFLTLSLFLLIGYAFRSRDVTVFVLYMGAVAYALWSVCFAVSVLNTPDASLVAPAWPLLACLACCASAISVAKREGARYGPE